MYFKMYIKTSFYFVILDFESKAKQIITHVSFTLTAWIIVRLTVSDLYYDLYRKM